MKARIQGIAALTGSPYEKTDWVTHETAPTEGFFRAPDPAKPVRASACITMEKDVLYYFAAGWGADVREAQLDLLERFYASCLEQQRLREQSKRLGAT